jgi:hypothetical protein
VSPRPVRFDEDAAVHVHAPAAVAYLLVTDLRAWPQWWPGLRIDTVDAVPLRLRIGRGPAALRLTVEDHDWRHDVGVRLRLSGDLDGEAEWWMAPHGAGATVHLRTAAQVRSAAAARRWRRSVRRALWGTKDRSELAVRLALGRAP